MPARTTTYAKNSVVLKAAFVSVLRRRLVWRGAVAPSVSRSATPTRDVAGLLISSSSDVCMEYRLCRRCAPSMRTSRTFRLLMRGAGATGPTRLETRYPSLRGEHSFELAPAVFLAPRQPVDPAPPAPRHRR